MKKYAFAALISGLIVGPMAISAQAYTERKAKIVVVNETGKELSKVTVFHRYSNDIKNELSWENLAVGSSKLHDKPIRYGTGEIFPADWWIVTFTDKSGNQYISHPDNFRKFVDGIEGILSDSIPVIASIIVDPTGGLIKDTVTIVGKAALNKEATFHKELGVSFKRHTLFKRDENTTVKLILKSYEDDGVIIQSANGRNADTDYKPLTDRQNEIISQFTDKALEKLQKEIGEVLKKKQEASKSGTPATPR